MMRRLALIVLSVLCSASVMAQKIDKSKRELNSSSGQSSSTYSESRSSSNSYSDDSTNPFAELLFNVTIGAVYYGLVGNYVKETHLDNNLAHFPYYDGISGNYKPQDSVFRTNFRVDVESRFLYADNDLFGSHTKAKIRPFQYFYLQADYRGIVENTIGGERDRLALFHFNFAYDRLRFNRFNLGWTLGASYIGQGVNKAGFSYGLSAEYFLRKNISFDASAKWSSINGHPVNAYEFSARLHKKRFFLALGFEHLKIASPTYNFITAGAGVYLF